MSIDNPEPKKGWALAKKIAKVILFLVIGGIVLAVLFFGACMLMFATK